MLIYFYRKCNFSTLKEKLYLLGIVGGSNMSKIVFLGHASFLIEGNRRTIVIDPYADGSVPNLTFPRGIEADQVFCSHGHYDHNAINLVKEKISPRAVQTVERVVPHDHEDGKKRGLNTIRMFDIDGYKVVHLGDTGCVPSADLLEPFINCDVLLAPINGFFTINPKELKEICNIVKPRIVVPMHYYIKEKGTGYPDDNMFEKFQKEFPKIEYLDDELDLDKYKDYKGALVFKGCRQG